VLALGNDITLSDYKEILAAIMNNTSFKRIFKDIIIEYYPYEPDEGFMGLYIESLHGDRTVRELSINSSYFIIKDIINKLE